LLFLRDTEVLENHQLSDLPSHLPQAKFRGYIGNKATKVWRAWNDYLNKLSQA